MEGFSRVFKKKKYFEAKTQGIIDLEHRGKLLFFQNRGVCDDSSYGCGFKTY